MTIKFFIPFPPVYFDGYVLSFTNFSKVSKAKGHKKWLLLLLSVNWIIPFVGFGQKNNADTLANVVVSASRQQISALKTPYSVSVLQSKDIEKLASRATPDMLSNIPGVFIQKTNLGGGSAFVRGLTGNQTLLIIDGIRFNNSTFRYGPNQYLNTIDPSIISKVELLKGHSTSDCIPLEEEEEEEEDDDNEAKNFKNSKATIDCQSLWHCLTVSFFKLANPLAKALDAEADGSSRANTSCI